MSTQAAFHHSISAAGRWWLASLGLALAATGCLFTWVLWISYQRAMETRTWIATPARVTSSVIVSERPTPHSPVGHQLDLKYTYEFNGASHIGTRIKRVDGPTGDLDRVQDLAAEYPKGAGITCYVNPMNPAEAILRQSSKAAVYTLWFPLLFVIGGGVMAWRAIRRPAGS